MNRQDLYPAAGQRWRHYKGMLYEVVSLSYDEETGLARVNYKAADANGGLIHGRLMSSFLGYDPETHAKRFYYEGDNPLLNDYPDRFEPDPTGTLSALLASNQEEMPKPVQMPPAIGAEFDAPSNCNNHIRRVNPSAAIPRTCAKCGLGPCPYFPLDNVGDIQGAL